MNDAVISGINEILSVLWNADPSIYLYGSVTDNDFRIGWSDIDFICLTKAPLEDVQAEKLLTLREHQPDNPYFRLFEGVFISQGGFFEHRKEKVVYWGTGKSKIIDSFTPDCFCRYQLAENAILLFGDDLRDFFEVPKFSELRQGVAAHLETIRKHAVTTGRSIYSYGWLLDIARGLYVLKNGVVVSKTAAGEWALENGLCPDMQALATAVSIRNNPKLFNDNPVLQDYSERLGDSVQLFADVLEDKLTEFD
ncbi:MAG: nucleotidyltransferase domain-containing protein [Ruminococcus sp.]|nr:nucleotidyltransferase domain-containing protein [Ruminococcus sp.]